MLVPDDWCEPLAPLMQMAGRRSTLPSDLSPEQPALLVDLVSPVDQPVLTARVADVVWSYGDKSRSDLLDVAIDTYRTIFPCSAARSSSRTGGRAADHRPAPGEPRVHGGRPRPAPGAPGGMLPLTAAGPGGQVDDDAISPERVRDLAVRLEDLVEICARPPIMPVAHAQLWAAGLWCGVKRELPTAAALLVPQMEHLVRLHLKNGGAQTTHVDDETGVGTEKGSKALLDLPEAVPVLGEDLALELRALLVAPEGPNLRSRLAHGLITDAEAWSASTVYAWWLALRLVISSLWTTREPAQQV